MAGRTAQPLIEATPPLPRDRATDKSNILVWETLGLAVRDPQTGELVPSTPPPNLGQQTRTTPVTDDVTGRPDFYKPERVIVQARNLRALAPKAIGPGTIRRNVTWPLGGGPIGSGGLRSLYSEAGSASGDAPRLFEPSNPAEYVASSVHLQLARPLPTVVAGRKPSIPDGPSGSHTGVVHSHSTGWPVVAPNVPSFGSRVAPIRPQALVTG